MLSEQLALLARVRHDDLRRTAAQRQSLHPVPPLKPSASQRFALWLGGLLIRLGVALQKRVRRVEAGGTWVRPSSFHGLEQL